MLVPWPAPFCLEALSLFYRVVIAKKYNPQLVGHKAIVHCKYLIERIAKKKRTHIKPGIKFLHRQGGEKSETRRA
jgi:hypothetical protein